MTFGKEKNAPSKISPVSLYFDWKSDKENKTGKFKGRNKDLQTEIAVVPTEFILLETTSCVKGWDDSTQSGIYSNEIINLKNEELIVKAFKGTHPIYQGKYDKEKLGALNCKFNKGIIVQEGDTIVEYYLSGGALFAWNEQTEGIDYNEFKIKFDGVEEKKKGAVVYYVPKRTQGSKITEEERAVAMHSVELLNEYHNG